MEQPVDPWQRWAWLLAAVWLAFLVFPVVALLQSERPLPPRLLGLAAVAAFAVVYVRGFVRAGREGGPAQDTARWSRWYLLALSVLVLVVMLVVGSGAVGMTMFLVTFSMFLLPLRWALVVTVASAAVVVGVPLVLGDLDETWFLLPILLLVAGSTGLISFLEQRGEEHRVLADQVTIATERERVARDVHDVLGHSLTALTIKAELAERLVDRDPAAAKAELAQIRALTREALSEIRATVGGLRIARLGDELEVARRTLADAGIEADVPASPDAVDPRHRLVLAWVLREAVTNVVRHSGAGRCEVALDHRAMRVVDDGRGVAGHVQGNGLRGITERVRSTGGELQLATGPSGRGTMLEVRW